MLWCFVYTFFICYSQELAAAALRPLNLKKPKDTVGTWAHILINLFLKSGHFELLPFWAYGTQALFAYALNITK